MYKRNTQEQEVINYIDTSIWDCQAENCNGWMREDFSLEENPTCPMCGEIMIHEIRNLPEIKKELVWKNNQKY